MDQKDTAPKENATEEKLIYPDEVERIRYRLESELEDLNKKKKKFERDKKDFQKKKEAEKKELQRQKENEKRRLAQEDQLFKMKWKLLEEEVQKLAFEKQRVERQRTFYERVSDFERKGEQHADTGRIVRGDMFFAGVTSELALKKRYKDLIKIYHPDNVSGDTNTIQEINREYDKLKNRLESC